MFLQRFYDDELAQASYLVGCQATGEAIVIDPARATAVYHEAAKAQGLGIVAVTETHIHADFLSGSRQLAYETGSRLYLSGEGGQDWSYLFAAANDKIVHDGDLIRIGNLSLKVLHTPGHTPEHISFLLTDHPASERPIGVFTGDFLFVGDVGRPDLLERAAGHKDTMRAGARRLFESLKKFATLPDHLQIWPGHGAGSACGKALGAVPSSVLGYEKLSNWAFKVQEEEAFVEEILSGQPEPPTYFAQMKYLNRVGPTILLADSPPPVEGLEELRQLLVRGELLIDLRGSKQFAYKHLPGSLFLPPSKGLATWAGWLLPYDAPFSVLLGDVSELPQALETLRSIGLDNLRAFYLPDALSGQKLVGSERISANQLDTQNDFVLDVRSQREYTSGHLSEAHHIHLGELQRRMKELPDSLVVHCQSGQRSLIATSLLERAGKHPCDIIGGYSAIEASRVVVCSSQ